jgi:hypothetical protein
MANIVSSTFEAFVQKDGRKTVHETHTDVSGMVRDLVYTAQANDDLSTLLTTHASVLGDWLGDMEVQTNVGAVVSTGSLATPTFIFSTVVDNVAALRASYRDATDRQAVMIGDYLNTLTNGQIASAFGITTGQAATLRTNKLVPAASIATSIRAAVGQ